MKQIAILNSICYSVEEQKVFVSESFFVFTGISGFYGVYLEYNG